jgi:hypothetical protein
VAKHTTHLCESHSLAHQRVDAFLKRSYADQAHLIEALRQDPWFASYLNDEAIDLQQKLIATWDSLSLYVCGALGEREELDSVPFRDGLGRLQLAPDAQDAEVLTVAPWPFRAPEIPLHWDALVFSRRFEDQSDLSDHFGGLETVSLSVTLRPG